MNRHERRATMPSKAILERLANRIEKEGCPKCGFRFATGMPYYVAKTADGQWASSCPPCADGFLVQGPLIVGACVWGADPWVEDDRVWFAANPQRRWRLRRPMKGEVEAVASDEAFAEKAGVPASCAASALVKFVEPASWAIAVFQFQKGQRARFPFEYTGADPIESFTDAAVARFLPAVVQRVEAMDVQSTEAREEMFIGTYERRLKTLASVLPKDDK